MFFVGIDPELTGAVGVLNERGNYITCFDLPTQPKPSNQAKVKRELDPLQLYQQLKSIFNNKGTAVIEKIASRPNQGVVSTFSLGDSFGVLRGLFSLSMLTIHFVVPIVWKRSFDLLGRSKSDSRMIAQSFYPEASLKRKIAIVLKHYC